MRALRPVGWFVVLVLGGGCELIRPSAPNPFSPTLPVSGNSPPVPTGNAVLLPAPPVPVSTTDPVVGRYAVELAVGPGCTAVPPEVKTRTYTAVLVPMANSRDDYETTLSDATFLEDARCHNPDFAPRERALCNQGWARPNDFEGDTLLLFREIVERLADGRWLKWTASVFLFRSDLAGVQDGTMPAATATSVAAVSYWFGVPAGSSFAICNATDARMTFTKK